MKPRRLGPRASSCPSRSSMRRSSIGVGRSSRCAGASLIAGLEVGEQRLQVVGRERIRRHLVARLDAPADRAPSRRDGRGVFGSVPAPMRAARREVRQIRADVAVRVVPRMVWHSVHAARHEDIACRAARRSRGGAGGLRAAASSHRSNSASRLGDDVERHVRVLQAAELGALAAKDARPVGLQPDRGRVAGNQIALAVEVRHPEAVDDVARRAP